MLLFPARCSGLQGTQLYLTRRTVTGFWVWDMSILDLRYLAIPIRVCIAGYGYVFRQPSIAISCVKAR